MRFQLTAPHYLNVVGNQWEYKEIDRSTGKEKRHLRNVPMCLHPEDQSNWNYVTERGPVGQVVDGIIVVSTKESSEFPKDYIFTGAPTMDMIPLDDEAKVAIAALQGKWKHPVMEIPGNFAEQLPLLWQQQFQAAADAKALGQGPSVSTRELDELRKNNETLTNQLAELKAIVEAIAHAPQASTPARRPLL